MADYNWDMKSDVGGYLGEENKPVSTYNSHQDEFGFKEGNDDQRTGGGDTDGGVGGRKSGASNEGTGAYDRPSCVQSQFGLEGKTGSDGTEGSNPHLGGADTGSSAAIDPRASAFDQATAPGGDGWRPEDLLHTHASKEHTNGSKKDGLMNQIKEKMPGHHNTAAVGTTDPKADSKILEKIKEKLPGHHGNDAGM